MRVMVSNLQTFRVFIQSRRRILKYAALGAIAITAGYFAPVVFSVFVLCGLWDVSRHDRLDRTVLKQYFFVNGIGTWLASPANIVLDIFALPYRNRGIYKIEDLPAPYRKEVHEVVNSAKELNIQERIAELRAEGPRTMYFFKWYGKNLTSEFTVPEFHRSYRYIRTIGVSVFRPGENTSRHFGPFRPTLRVLYCLLDNVEPGAYIQVGSQINRWSDEPLFIFDDTLIHQSFNQSELARPVLFVDILRPSYVPWLFDAVVALIRTVFRGYKRVFYRNWKIAG